MLFSIVLSFSKPFRFFFCFFAVPEPSSPWFLGIFSANRKAGSNFDLQLLAPLAGNKVSVSLGYQSLTDRETF